MIEFLERFCPGRPPDATVESEYEDGGIRVMRLKFKSVQGDFDSDRITDCSVFALLAFPVDAAMKGKKLPGMLILHGGKGIAEEVKAAGWAKRGYIAVAPELPGWVDPDRMRSGSRFGGQPYKRNRFTTDPAVTASGVFDSVMAAVRAFRLLQAHPSTDAKRIGMTGISWGGYLSTLLSGLLADEAGAGFALYGCGFYDRGTVFAKELDRLPPQQKRLWLEHYDARNVLKRIRSPFLMVPATNDSFFYPPAAEATWQAIASLEKRFCYGPGSDHRIDWEGGSLEDGPSYLAIEPIYFHFALNGMASRLPAVEPVPGQEAFRYFENGGRLREPWAFATSDIALPWTERRWMKLDVRLDRLKGEVRIVRAGAFSELDWIGGAHFELTEPDGAGTCLFPQSTVVMRVRGGAAV